MRTLYVSPSAVKIPKKLQQLGIGQGGPDRVAAHLDVYDALVRCGSFHGDADGVHLGLLSFRLILHLTRVRILVAVESVGDNGINHQSPMLMALTVERRTIATPARQVEKNH